MHLQSCEVSWNIVGVLRACAAWSPPMCAEELWQGRLQYADVFESALTGGLFLPGRDSCREYCGGSSALSQSQFISSSAVGATGWVLLAACVPAAAVELAPGFGSECCGRNGSSSLDGLVSIRGNNSCEPDPLRSNCCPVPGNNIDCLSSQHIVSHPKRKWVGIRSASSRAVAGLLWWGPLSPLPDRRSSAKPQMRLPPLK